MHTSIYTLHWGWPPFGQRSSLVLHAGPGRHPNDTYVRLRCVMQPRTRKSPVSRSCGIFSGNSKFALHRHSTPSFEIFMQVCTLLMRQRNIKMLSGSWACKVDVFSMRSAGTGMMIRWHCMQSSRFSARVQVFEHAAALGVRAYPYHYRLAKHDRCGGEMWGHSCLLSCYRVKTFTSSVSNFWNGIPKDGRLYVSLSRMQEAIGCNWIFSVALCRHMWILYSERTFAAFFWFTLQTF